MLGKVPYLVVLLLAYAAAEEGVNFKNWWDGDVETCPWMWNDTFTLAETLDGRVVYPGEDDFKNATTALNVNFNTDFSVVIYPHSEADLIKIAKFANTKKVRVSVRSTGHCYLGRSMMPDTMSVNMIEMKEMSVNLNDPESPTGASLTTQTGNNWLNIYTEADKHGNRVVVGGSAKTVSPGGYYLGAGHSPITPYFGLSVDSGNLLKIRMVTIDGRILTVTKNSTIEESEDGTETEIESDLWFALRGAGYGFGFVVSFTMVMHDPPPAVTRLYMAYAIKDPSGNPVGGEGALDNLANFLVNNPDPRLGGYIISSNAKFDIPGIPGKFVGTVMFSLVFLDTYEEASSYLEDIYNYGAQYFPTKNYDKYETFLEYEQTANDETGANVYLAGLVLLDEDLSTPSLVSKLYASTIVKEPVIYYTCVGIIIGGNMRTTGNVDESAAGPDYRSGRISTACAALWEGYDASRDYVVPRYQAWLEENIYDKGRGVYPNEADYYLDDWKEKFWGSDARYQRLLSEKQRWDPEALFACRQCVGADLDNPGKCKPSGPSPGKAALTHPESYIIFLLILLTLIMQP